MYKSIFSLLVIGCLLSVGLEVMTVGQDITSPPSDALLQFTSHGHVLGFTGQSVYAATGSHAYRVSFVSATPTSPVAEGTVSDSRQIASLGRVTYPGLWDGITLIYDAPNGALLRSTYLLDPYADPAQIRLRYNTPAQIAGNGSLTLSYATGTVTESAPIAWQELDGEHRAVSVAFVQHTRDTVGFVLGDYDPSLPLSIDPSLTWNTFLGGAGEDLGLSIAVDAGGAVYVTGSSKAPWGDSPVRPHTGDGYYDAFIAKLDSNGELSWLTFLGAAQEDQGTAIALDASGEVYVIGFSYTSWNETPVRPHTDDTEVDTFIAKLNKTNGELTWHTFLGGEDVDIGNAITVNDTGEIYAIGQGSARWGGEIDPIRDHSEDHLDAFIVRLDSNGELSWYTFLGGTGPDIGSAIAVDGSRVYGTGYSYYAWGDSPVRPFSTYDNEDAFVVKLDKDSGELTWHTFLGGRGDDMGHDIAVDGSGALYVVGDSEFPWPEEPVRPFSHYADCFVAKLNNDDGELTWHTFLGSDLFDRGTGIFANRDGVVYVTGTSSGTWESPLDPFSGYIDAFVAKLTRDGALTWNTFLGEGGRDVGVGISMDGMGNLYVVGYSTETWGSPVNAFTNGTDAFVFKFKDFYKYVFPIFFQ